MPLASLFTEHYRNCNCVCKRELGIYRQFSTKHIASKYRFGSIFFFILKSRDLNLMSLQGQNGMAYFKAPFGKALASRLSCM